MSTTNRTNNTNVSLCECRKRPRIARITRMFRIAKVEDNYDNQDNHYILAQICQPNEALAVPTKSCPSCPCCLYRTKFVWIRVLCVRFRFRISTVLFVRRVCLGRHGFGSVSRINSRTLALRRVRIGEAMLRHCTDRGGRFLRFAIAFVHWTNASHHELEADFDGVGGGGLVEV